MSLHGIIVISWIVEEMVTFRLYRFKYITKFKCYLYDGIFELLASVALVLYVRPFPEFLTSILMLCTILDLYRAWKHRNDEDDNDKGKRLFAKIKSKLPKPVVVKLRPIQQGAS